MLLCRETWPSGPELGDEWIRTAFNVNIPSSQHPLTTPAFWHFQSCLPWVGRRTLCSLFSPSQKSESVKGTGTVSFEPLTGGRRVPTQGLHVPRLRAPGSSWDQAHRRFRLLAAQAGLGVAGGPRTGDACPFPPATPQG